MLTRKEIEKKEETLLASYAMKSNNSRGRVHREEEHDYRSRYQRDKDRIIHSTAFRRLEYKTQVFVNHEGDHYRTRLTHTLEVSQIGKAIARALRLNEDLVEAIALAHDLGHTPFGHSGEDALHSLMKRHGGFNHNLQGLRVVDLLEDRYPQFPGLNLTYEVREGIIKHTTTFDKVRLLVPFEKKELPSLETQVVDVADEIAYDNHDLDDGLASGMLQEKDLCKEVELWKNIYKKVESAYAKTAPQLKRYQAARALINAQVTDVITTTEQNIKQFKIQTTDNVRKMPHKLVCFSKSMEQQRKPLRKFLLDNLYHHYRVIRMSNKAYRFINELFRVYRDKPEQLPPTTQSRLKKETPHRAICDYIAGMTDRYALDEYRKFFEPYTKV
jgi:dGTPase